MPKNNPKNISNTDFSLIETLLWEKGGYFLLDLHIKRLLASAKHFARTADRKKLAHSLREASQGFSMDKSYRVRMLLDAEGNTKITASPLEDLAPGAVKVAFSDNRTDPSDMFLYHKTTNRALYDAASKEAISKGLFDMIFTNLSGEVTEGAITNMMIRSGEDYFTPPLFCGLLPGVYRTYLIESQEIPVKEKVLFKEDLFKADAVFVMNSVRKLLPATLV